MSHTSRPAVRRAEGPRGRPAGAMAGTGTGGTVVPVIDPDMEALFEEFLKDLETFSATESQSRRQPYHYMMRDTEQKGLCLHNGHLVATSLQGANSAQEEPISVVPNIHLERQRCPLIVGIQGGSQALSCGTGPEPQLKLEKVELLDLFSRGKEATPYTFYKTFGGSTHTFESAAFPGHFLCTSQAHGEPLAVAPPRDITDFYLLRK